MPSLGEQDGGWAQGSYHLWAPSPSSQPRRLSPTSREAPRPRALQGSGEPDAGSCPTGTHSPACSRRTAFVTFLTCCHWFGVRPSMACGAGCKQPQQPLHGGVRRHLQASGHAPANRVREAEGTAAAGGRAGGQPGPWAQAPPGQGSLYTGLSPGALQGGASRNVPTQCWRPRWSNRDRGGSGRSHQEPPVVSESPLPRLRVRPGLPGHRGTVSPSPRNARMFWMLWAAFLFLGRGGPRCRCLAPT